MEAGFGKKGRLTGVADLSTPAFAPGRRQRYGGCPSSAELR
jgi:hypothetical protein